MKAADLFEANRGIAEACRDHPFVQGIASGRLDPAAFCFYVGQDAAFLDAFVRAYALGVAKAPDRETLAAFKALLDGGFVELELHQGYAGRWGVDLAPEPEPATTAYTDFLLRVAALEPVAHLCAAMTPCMRLYAWLGTELLPVAAPDSPYREWVETYASPEFQQLAVVLEGLLDRLGGDPDTVAAHYRRAMQLELAFFDSAAATGGTTTGEHA
ncbi:MAG: Thiaminase II involved in salvage of thiamin pyrimidine moiety, TenA subgroup with Cys in active site [uncultured Acidimicrobiales bacterium]|uniref:Thiaminase II involved in salvage of thiamin pyrimidine moiety, TenA subgroup with Cys in active site n=1 Tax=uncultured Acidimicrobiales bacterium TaxID=310071 RepID=A0A6J4IWN1_9ACTN|nr:MAG: Thiaminase II involved in salvage of thiamin pyrimidine moiety, TenA subgroup with Cys in active site [uncultured Acidimicrobiales bacterium]